MLLKFSKRPPQYDHKLNALFLAGCLQSFHFSPQLKLFCA